MIYYFCDYVHLHTNFSQQKDITYSESKKSINRFVALHGHPSQGHKGLKSLRKGLHKFLALIPDRVGASTKEDEMKIHRECY